jgi:hypothetical protein
VSWSGTIEAMLDELRRGEARAQSYWAQQLAFAPVVVHALSLTLRDHLPPVSDREAISAAVALALSALGALPEQSGVEPSLLAAMAQRQARALSWGRRRTLQRLLRRLGTGTPLDPGAGAARLLRPYPLLGWRPDSRLQA